MTGQTVGQRQAEDLRPISSKVKRQATALRTLQKYVSQRRPYGHLSAAEALLLAAHAQITKASKELRRAHLQEQ